MTQTRPARIPLGMLPIRDHNPSGQTPCAGWVLIALNIVVFMAYYPLGSGTFVTGVYHDWGMIPARLSAGEGLWTPLTALFIHGGWFHLGLNLLFLWVFGPRVEAVMGSWRFVSFYLLCGMIATALQFLANPGSAAPVAGASGAVAGVMGAYLLLFPRAKVDLLVYYILGLRTLAVPAWALLGLWFALQVWGGLATPASGGVAFWAHVGGFLAGVGLCARSWRLRGGRRIWRTQLAPPAGAPVAMPVVRRRGVVLPPPQPRGLFRRD
ncbi:MAG: rhomboid family intramembrane serine protease [Pararhodobacter sp.]